MIPQRLITTWICNERHGSYRESDKKLFYKCFESWHRLMPDWDIRIISLANVFDYGTTPYAERLLLRDSLIGLSNWARLWWLHQIGGIYVDMDVEAIRRFDPLLDEDRLFAVHFGKEPFLGNGVIGSTVGHSFLWEQLRQLSKLDPDRPEYGNESGPRLMTRLFRERGWNGVDTSVSVSSDLYVYPHTLFYPYHWSERFSPDHIKADTVAIHHWASSWDQHNPATPEWSRA